MKKKNVSSNMNSSVELTNTSLSRQEAIKERLARYIDCVKNLEVENKDRFVKEADDRLAVQQETHANDIQELREKYELQMKSNREEIEALFETKMKTLQNASKRDKEALTDALKEMNIAHNRIDDSSARILILEQINSSLHGRVNDLQSVLESERTRSAKSQTEINRLREEMALQLEEYQELMDKKNSLAVEIAAYDKLLSGAEQRLKLSSNLVAGSKKRKSDNTKNA